VNPHQKPPTSIFSLVSSLARHSGLIVQMANREVIARYKESILGLLWSFVHPLLMLAVYTFIFSVVFKVKWGVEIGDGKPDFALILFAGLITHTLLSEVLNTAHGLILNNINYVKKVVFPLEILSVVSVVTALFHAVVSISILLIALMIMNGHLYWTVFLFPIVIMPLVILSLGFSWVLASLGVFVRDVGQLMGIVTTVLLFLSPIFFPVSAIPEPYQIFIFLNPLTFIIEQIREVLIWGRMPNWQGLGIYTLFSTAFCWIGFVWFQKTRKWFADVI
jgi:lipopolysaccharide transport system permease protein